MLTPDMKRVIEEQRLGFVATAAPDGTPNVSPKGPFAVLGDRTIAFGEIRSPGTIRNLRANPRIEVNFVDVFVRKGYRFAGTATVLERGEPGGVPPARTHGAAVGSAPVELPAPVVDKKPLAGPARRPAAFAQAIARFHQIGIARRAAQRPDHPICHRIATSP